MSLRADTVLKHHRKGRHRKKKKAKKTLREKERKAFYFSSLSLCPFRPKTLKRGVKQGEEGRRRAGAPALFILPPSRAVIQQGVDLIENRSLSSSFSSSLSFSPIFFFFLLPLISARALLLKLMMGLIEEDSFAISFLFWGARSER